LRERRSSQKSVDQRTDEGLRKFRWPTTLVKTDSNTVDQLTLAGTTINDADVESNVWLLPLPPADYVGRAQTDGSDSEPRIFDDIADEETELLDEEILDLIAAKRT
jgi:hypothetical protein